MSFRAIPLVGHPLVERVYPESSSPSPSPSPLPTPTLPPPALTLGHTAQSKFANSQNIHTHTSPSNVSDT